MFSINKHVRCGNMQFTRFVDRKKSHWIHWLVMKQLSQLRTETGVRIISSRRLFFTYCSARKSWITFRIHWLLVQRNKCFHQQAHLLNHGLFHTVGRRNNDVNSLTCKKPRSQLRNRKPGSHCVVVGAPNSSCTYMIASLESLSHPLVLVQRKCFHQQTRPLVLYSSSLCWS
jgi:hypothetical protein